MQGACGVFALACYSPVEGRMVVPGEDPAAQTSVESVLAHEYGHHLAASRLNPPWEAVAYGTKRWASYEQICRDAQAGLVYPGAEDFGRYRLNPGEGFAEAYRVFNERRLARPEAPWEIVSPIFYPDAPALGALEQDITAPWRSNTVSTVRGGFSRPGTRTRTYGFTAMLDGAVSATLRAPSTARLRLELLSSGGSRISQAVVAGGGKVAQGIACGSRSFGVRVTRLAGSGEFRLVLSRP
ncbi:MAG: hypothetical protein ABR583_14340 [Gaiellaceae bacterium]